ncbi:MAG: hypothetical protein EOM87_03160, partial [Clostridia bacterium]|nr:hypothetical protein [Clostridia bacterium]
MSKRISLFIVIITLVCLATFGLVACKDISPIIINPNPGGGPNNPPVGEVVNISTSDFFGFVEYVLNFASQSLATDQDEDYLVFSFQSNDIALTVDQVTKLYYINFKAKYNRVDDKKSDLLFELREKTTQDMVIGFYYDAGKFYLDIAGSDGPNLIINEVNLQQMVQLASSATGSMTGIVDMITGLEFGGFNIGSMVSGVLSGLIKSATLTTTGDKKVLDVETDLSNFISGMFNLLKTVSPILNQFYVDDILNSLFGLRLVNILNYPLEKMALTFSITTEKNVFSQAKINASYGGSMFAFGMQFDAIYYGTDVYGITDIVFPSFVTYDSFSVFNIDVEFNLVYDNGIDQTVTIGDTIGGILSRFFGVTDIGNLGRKTISLGEGTMGVKGRLQTSLDMQNNENNVIILALSGLDGSALANIVYRGKDETVFVDLSPIGLPKVKYSGINLAHILNNLLGGLLGGMLTGEAAAAVETGMTETYGGNNLAQAIGNYSSTATYEVATAGDVAYVKMDTFKLIVAILNTLEKQPGGRKAIAITIDRSTLKTVLNGMGFTQQENLNTLRAVSRTGMTAAEIAALDASIASAESTLRIFDVILGGMTNAYSDEDILIREIRMEIGLLDGEFGIYADIDLKLNNNLVLSLEIPRATLGARPQFVIDVNAINKNTYVDLDELSTISLSAQISVDMNSGSLTTLDLNSALGGIIAELACVLNVKNPFNGGFDIVFDANIGLDNFKLSDIIAGNGFNLELGKIELAVRVYEKGFIDKAHQILAIYYYEFAPNESAIFVDASGISIDGSVGLPMFMYKINIEDMLMNLLSGEEGLAQALSTTTAGALGDEMTPETLIKILGGIFGGISIDQGEFAMYLGERLIATVFELLLGTEDVDGIISLADSSRVYMKTSEGFEVGLVLSLDTSDGTPGYVNPYLSVRMHNFVLALQHRDILPSAANWYDAYVDITALDNIYVSTELYMEYAWEDNTQLDRPSFSKLIGIAESIVPGSLADILDGLIFDIMVQGNISGEFRVKISANLDINDILGALELRVEILMNGDSIVTLYFDGEYVYFNASFGTVGDNGVKGFNLPNFKLYVGNLFSGIGEEATAEESEDGIMSNIMGMLLSNIGILSEININSRGVGIALSNTTISTLFAILGYDVGTVFDNLTPEGYVNIIGGVGVGLKLSKDANNYIAFGIDKISASFVRQDLGLAAVSGYPVLDINNLSDIGFALTGEIGLHMDAYSSGEQGATLENLVKGLIDGLNVGISVTEPVNMRLSFDLMANINIATLDFSDLSTALNILNDLEFLLRIYVLDQNGNRSATGVLLYYNASTQTVYAKAPLFGVGAVSYRGFDISALLGGLLGGEETAGAGEPSFNNKLLALCLNENSIAVVISGILIADALAQLGIDLGGIDLGAFIESVSVGLTTDYGVMLGVGLAGVSLEFKLDGIILSLEKQNLEQYAFRTPQEELQYIPISDENGALSIQEVYIAATVSFDFNTGVFGVDEEGNPNVSLSETLAGLANAMGLDATIAAIINQISIYIGSNSNLGDLFNMPIIIDFKAFINISSFDYAKLSIDISNANGKIFGIYYDSTNDAFYIDLSSLGAKKFKIEGTGVLSMVQGLLGSMLAGAEEPEEAGLDIFAMINSLIGSVTINGESGIIGIATTGNFLTTILSLLAIDMSGIAMPQIIAMFDLNLKDIGIGIGLSILDNASNEAFGVNIGIGGFAIAFSEPAGILPNDINTYYDWKDINFGFDARAQVEFAIDAQYAQTINDYIADQVIGNSFELFVKDNAANDILIARMGIDFAINVHLNSLIDTQIELFMSVYYMTSDGELYNDNNRLVTIYYNSHDRYDAATASYIESLYFIYGNTALSENGVRVDNLGIRDLVMNMLGMPQNAAAGEVAAAGDNSPLAPIISVLIDNGVIIGVNGGVVSYLLELTGLNMFLPPFDGVSVTASADKMELSINFNEKSHLAFSLNDYSLIFANTLTEKERYSSAINSIRANSTSLKDLGQIYFATSMSARLSVAELENTEEIARYTNYQNVLQVLLSSDSDRNYYYGVDIEMGIS